MMMSTTSNSGTSNGGNGDKYSNHHHSSSSSHYYDSNSHHTKKQKMKPNTCTLSIIQYPSSSSKSTSSSNTSSTTTIPMASYLFILMGLLCVVTLRNEIEFFPILFSSTTTSSFSRTRKESTSSSTGRSDTSTTPLLSTITATATISQQQQQDSDTFISNSVRGSSTTTSKTTTEMNKNNNEKEEEKDSSSSDDDHEDFMATSSSSSFTGNYYEYDEYEYYTIPIQPFYVEKNQQKSYAVSCEITLLRHDDIDSISMDRMMDVFVPPPILPEVSSDVYIKHLVSSTGTDNFRMDTEQATQTLRYLLQEVAINTISLSELSESFTSWSSLSSFLIPNHHPTLQTSAADTIHIPICIQTSNYMGAIVYQDNIKSTTTTTTNGSSTSTNTTVPPPIMKFLLDTTNFFTKTESTTDASSSSSFTIQHQRIKYFWDLLNHNTNHSYYTIHPMKNVHMPGHYKIKSQVSDQIRSYDSNRGNFMWSYGSTRMINPITIRMFDKIIVVSSSSINETETETNRIENDEIIKMDAVVLATANIFHLSVKGPIIDPILTTPVYKKIEIVETYPTDVPIIVLGLGVQYYFEETNSSETTTDSTDGLYHYESNPNQLQLEPYQKELLQAVTLHQPQHQNEQHQQQQSTIAKMIGVRGDLTERICLNSGIEHCISMGCPSLTISRDIHLGQTIQKKWDTLVSHVAATTTTNVIPTTVTNRTTTTTMNHNSTTTTTTNNNKNNNIKIGMTMPASWNNEDERLRLIYLQSYLHEEYDGTFFGQTGKEISLFKQKVQRMKNDNINDNMNNNNNNMNTTTTKPLHFVEFNNVETWVQYIQDEPFHLCLSPRIHGAMAFIAAGVPALVIPTDPRILELVQAMKIPYIILEDMMNIINEYETTYFMEKENSDDPHQVLRLILNKAQNTNFTEFEINRRTKLKGWKHILEYSGLTMDPALVRIINAPLL